MKAKQYRALVAALTVATTIAGASVSAFPVLADETQKTETTQTADLKKGTKEVGHITLKNTAVTGAAIAVDGDTIEVSGHKDAVAAVEGSKGTISIEDTVTPHQKFNDCTIGKDVTVAGTYTLDREKTDNGSEQWIWKSEDGKTTLPYDKDNGIVLTKYDQTTKESTLTKDGLLKGDTVKITPAKDGEVTSVTHA